MAHRLEQDTGLSLTMPLRVYAVCGEHRAVDTARRGESSEF
jgi:hypothetical protein